MKSKLLVLLSAILLISCDNTSDNLTEPTQQKYSEGQLLVIHGTWMCDLDLGIETQEGADFWWQQKTDIERYLTPKNDAVFSIIGLEEFDTISYSDLVKLNYSSQKIDGSANTNNQIPQGTVVAAITNEGRYSKFIIEQIEYNLTISWVTYEEDN